MAATLIDGKAIAATIRAEVKADVAALREKGLVPKLSVLLVGDDPASVVYARSKEKSCSNVGIDFELVTLPGTTPVEEVLATIDAWNKDPKVHGIMIELPLPKGMDKKVVLEAVDPKKDVDGSHPINRGYILSGGEGLFPATPESCIEVMLRSG
ncbi:MAG: bifunctional methylenetetrahydrofolate dehydrogenase/methenyltetrahydrofolate cyclohydrolase, partial [Desulfotomaculaceae bacterium]